MKPVLSASSSRCSSLVTLLTISGVALSLAEVARADVKIVSRVTTTGASRTTAPQTVVTSFKGDIVRTETDRIISLYNTKNQTITTLNKQNKTYRILSLKTAFAKAPGLLSKLRFDTTATMEPQEQTKIIAGKPARKYAGKATLKMVVDGMPTSSNRQTSMEIEQWASEAVSLPADARDAMSPMMRLSGTMQNVRGMEPLADALANVKGTPLSSRITITATGAPPLARGPIVTTNDVLSISEAPLNPALFRIPAGYKKVGLNPIPAPPQALNSRATTMNRGHRH